MCPFSFFTLFTFMVSNKFIKHPNSIGETYSQHLLKAFSFGCRFLSLSVLCFVHGVFPFAFEHTTSDKLKCLNDTLQQRRGEGDVEEN